MQAAPVRANPDLEARIVEIEQRNVQAPWPESAALIEALGPEVAQASPEQRARVELVRLRNLALAGDFRASTDGIAAFLTQDVSATLKLRALGLCANVAVAAGDYFRAFSWLKQGRSATSLVGKACLHPC